MSESKARLVAPMDWTRGFGAARGTEKAFWLSFDHWFTTISLEPKDARAADEIVMIGRSMGIDFQNSAET